MSQEEAVIRAEIVDLLKERFQAPKYTDWLVSSGFDNIWRARVKEGHKNGSVGVPIVAEDASLEWLSDKVSKFSIPAAPTVLLDVPADERLVESPETVAAVQALEHIAELEPIQEGCMAFVQVTVVEAPPTEITPPEAVSHPMQLLDPAVMAEIVTDLTNLLDSHFVVRNFLNTSDRLQRMRNAVVLEIPALCRLYHELAHEFRDLVARVGELEKRQEAIRSASACSGL